MHTLAFGNTAHIMIYYYPIPSSYGGDGGGNMIEVRRPQKADVRMLWQIAFGVASLAVLECVKSQDRDLVSRRKGNPGMVDIVVNVAAKLALTEGERSVVWGQRHVAELRS